MALQNYYETPYSAKSYTGTGKEKMWPKSYKDYPADEPLIKEQVEPSHGIIGCEMHDLNGWGLEHHIPSKQKKPKRKGWFYKPKRKKPES